MQTSTSRRIPDGLLIFLLGCLSAVSPFTIDLYLPAFPEMAILFQTTTARVALSVSTYFLGYAIGQLLYGPLLDRYGRKPPLYCGLAVYLAATIGCALAPTIEALLVIRAIQSLGGCVASVAAMTMVRDFFPPERGAKVFSLMMLVLGASPLFAPTIGGWIVSLGSWKLIFYTLFAGVALLLAAVAVLLPEGHQPDPTVTLRPRAMIRDFLQILNHRRFLTYTVAGSLSFAGLFVYVAGSPSIFMDGFGVSAQIYGYIFGVLGSGMVIGSQLNLLLGRRHPPALIFRRIVLAQVAIASVFFIGVWNGWYGLYATIACLFFLMTCTGIAYPNAAASALSPFKQNAGRAASLLGFVQLGTGAGLSSLVGLIDVRGTLPTAMTIAISSSLALLVLLILPDAALPTYDKADAEETSGPGPGQ